MFVKNLWFNGIFEFNWCWSDAKKQLNWCEIKNVICEKNLNWCNILKKLILIKAQIDENWCEILVWTEAKLINDAKIKKIMWK